MAASEPNSWKFILGIRTTRKIQTFQSYFLVRKLSVNDQFLQIFSPNHPKIFKNWAFMANYSPGNLVGRLIFYVVL